jgi:DNA-binding transcriptional MerR regulator
MQNEFSTFDLIKALKIPRERLREWMKRGYVHPTRKAEGQGDKAVFLREDVYALALFRRLVDFGFSRKLAGEFVTGFTTRERNEPPHQKSEIIIFHIKGDKISVLTLAHGSSKEVYPYLWDINSGSLSMGRIPTLAKIKLPSGEPLLYSEEWDQVHMVNYRGLKKQVDEALSILD